MRSHLASQYQAASFAVATKDTSFESNWEVLPHPAYSSDIVASNQIDAA